MLRKTSKWLLVLGSVVLVLALHVGQGEKDPEHRGSGGGARESLVLARGGEEPATDNEVPTDLNRGGNLGPTTFEGQGVGSSSPPAGVRTGRAGGGCVPQAPAEAAAPAPSPAGRSWLEQVRNGDLDALQANANTSVRGSKDESLAGATCDVRSPLHVAEVLSRHNAEIQECYRQRAKINPMLEGSLELRFVVSPEGCVASVTVLESTLGDEELERAVVACMLGWSDFGRCAPGTGPHTYRQRYTFGLENK